MSTEPFLCPRLVLKGIYVLLFVQRVLSYGHLPQRCSGAQLLPAPAGHEGKGVGLRSHEEGEWRGP